MDKEQPIKVEVSRYDKLQYEFVMTNSFSAIQKMTTDYGQQTRLLVEDVLSIGQVNDVDINNTLREFYSDSLLTKIMCDTEIKYSDLNGINSDLTHAFRVLHKAVPSMKIPHFYAQISALNESIIVDDSIVGISLDKYLGADYPLYKNYYYPYQSRTMSSSRIVPDCLVFYLLSRYPLGNVGKRRLIDHMLHLGKMNWIAANVMSYPLYNRQIGFSEANIKWCRNNERVVWNDLKDYLCLTDPMVVRAYMHPAPNTEKYGKASSDALGVWIGARIVDSYMKNHTSVSIRQLLEMNDYDKMLADSHFGN